MTKSGKSGKKAIEATHQIMNLNIKAIKKRTYDVLVIGLGISGGFSPRFGNF